MNKTLKRLKVATSKSIGIALLISLPTIGFSQIVLPTAGGTCAAPTRVCTKDSITVESTANGEKGTNGNRPSCSGLPFNQSTYMIFKVKKSGTLNFDIKPESSASEYDWFLYEYQGCGTAGAPLPGELVCNFATNKRNAAAPANTGLSATGTGTAGSQDPYTREITVDNCKEYLLQIDHYGEYVSGAKPNTTPDGSLGYTIVWSGTFEIEPFRDFNVKGKTDDNQIFCCAPYTVDFADLSDKACGGNITWDFGDGTTATGDNASHEFADAKTYVVTLTMATPDNCSYTKVKNVIIQPVPFLRIPNAFSPINRVDANDKNSVFDVQIAPTGVLDYSISIFDRWGKKIFTSKDPTQKWNGGVDNDLSKLNPVGVYVYSIHAEFENGTIEDKAGTVAITN